MGLLTVNEPEMPPQMTNWVTTGNATWIIKNKRKGSKTNDLRVTWLRALMRGEQWFSFPILPYRQSTPAEILSPWVPEIWGYFIYIQISYLSFFVCFVSLLKIRFGVLTWVICNCYTFTFATHCQFGDSVL